MSIDYEGLEFKCGLEIHQQLEGKKLFCDCNTLNSDKKADVKFERKLMAVAGEAGSIDAAAEFEMLKGKRFIYEGSSEDTCLVEYDDEPPHKVNMDALDTALKVAFLLNAKIMDEIMVMRKNVIDGSNVSGFQRTMLIATGGHFSSSKGTVTVPTICLEEESAQKLEDGKDFVKYKLDRLGIPLIEIATGTEIKNSEHAKEVAAHIGMILRSVGVKRGLGTIRQDVNISIKGGERTEIKGFQDLRSIPKVIEFEVKRQIEDIKNGKKILKEVRKAEADFKTSFLRPMPGSARLYPETDVASIRISDEHVKKLGSSLPKLISEKISEYGKKYSISSSISKELIEIENFEELVGKFTKIEPSAIANILINTPKDIQTRFGVDSGKLSNKDFEEALAYLNEGKIAKEAVAEILIKKIKNEKIELRNFEKISDEDIEKEISKIIKEKPGLSASAYMGLVMARYRGKIDGKKAMELINKEINP